MFLVVEGNNCNNSPNNYLINFYFVNGHFLDGTKKHTINIMYKNLNKRKYIFIYSCISLFFIVCVSNSCNLKEKNEVLVSQKAYYYISRVNPKDTNLTLINISVVKQKDTLIRRFEYFPIGNITNLFMKTDSLGLLCKEVEEGEYKRFLFFDTKKTNRLTLRGIPTMEDGTNKEILNYRDSIRLKIKLLKLYDTLSNNQKERRIKYEVIGREIYYIEEINSNFELICKKWEDYTWLPLNAVPTVFKNVY